MNRTILQSVAYKILVAGLLSTAACHSYSDKQCSDDKNRRAVETLMTTAQGLSASSPDSALKLLYQARRKASQQISPDTVTVNLFLTLARLQITTSQPDSALASLSRAGSLARQSNDSLNLCRALLQIAELHQNNGNVWLSRDYLNEALAVSEKINNRYLQGVARNYLGLFYSDRGDKQRALELFLEAYKFFSTSNDSSGLAGLFINIGNTFEAIGSTEEAAYYYRKAALKASNNHDFFNQIAALRNIGILFRYSKPDSALFFLLKADSLEPNSSNPVSALIGKFNRANLHLDRKEYKTASKLFAEVYESSVHLGITAGVARALSGIASVEEDQLNYPKALASVNQAISLADSAGDASLKTDLMKQKLGILKKTGMLAEALNTSEEISTFRDSLLPVEKQTAIHQMERLFQVQQQNSENQLLRLQVEQQAAMLLARQKFIVALMIGAIVLVVLFWRMYLLYTDRKKAYNALIKQYRKEDETRLIPQLILSKPVQNEIDSGSVKPGSPEDVLSRLLNYLETEKPYLDPKLKAETVAERLETNQRTLNLALKLHQQSNFSAFISQLRVEEAKRLLVHPKFRNYTIAALAADAGFGSKQSFYNAFEQFTGLKPATYRTLIYQKNSASATSK
ncbi:MAG: AraC family transcriptional regulator [Bacteroidales bacterium]|nr:AraC family transcriptional regulator [Bacteroidales bacterium]MDD3665689.1 AraC family transcriptional regulator [Bacteroidales bacterium]